jgi:hypothetical protein
MFLPGKPEVLFLIHLAREKFFGAMINQFLDYEI